MQSKHASLPGINLYVPATHAVTLRPVPVYPALATHAAADALPVLSVTVSGPHDVQAVAPVVLEYAPRPHAVNGPMGFPKNPALAMQAELSAFGTDPVVQKKHMCGV